MIEVIKDDRVPDFCHKTEYSAGYDLYACINEPIDVLPGETKLIPTGIKINMMTDCPSCMGLVFPRSGVSLKTNLRIANSVGLIDADYQGEIKVIMWNCGNKTELIKPLDRIAQLVFANHQFHTFNSINFVKEFSNSTERGSGGFGSTGK